MIETHLVDRLEQVDPISWNALVGRMGFYSSYEWLQSQEGAPGVSHTYLLVVEDGVLVAATPIYDFGAAANPAPSVATDPRRSLWCGPRTGYHNQLLLLDRSDRARARSLARLLVDRLAELAVHRDMEAVRMDYLPGEDVALLQGGYDVSVSLRETEAVIHNDARTFAGYERLLGRNSRKRASEWRRFDRAGLRVDTVRLSESLDDVVPLAVNTAVKYGAGLPADEVRRFLSEQVRRVDDASVVFRCIDQDDNVIGFSVCFAWRDELYARVAGFDYGRLQGVFEYFNTVYYAPMHYMAAHELSTLHLGVSALDAKVRRGATLHPLWTCIIPAPLRGGAVSAASQASDQAVADDVATLMGMPTSGPEWSLSDLLS